MNYITIKHLVLSLVIISLSFVACNQDDDEMPDYLKGIIRFKPYNTVEGTPDLVYSSGQIMFIIEMQLSGTHRNLDVDIEYHLLDGDVKVGEGLVKIDKNIDGGLMIYWGSEEQAIDIDEMAMQGKTLTVFLDPENQYTGSRYASPNYVNLYKKSSVLIP